MNPLRIEKPEASTCRVVFVRHGETSLNAERRFRGRIDVQLNDRGRAQVERTAEYLRDLPFMAAYSSPLARALQTAEGIAGLHSLPVTTRDELLDMDFGEWAGKRLADIDPEDVKLWRLSPELVAIPWGETLTMVMQRLLHFARELRHHFGEIVLVVSHEIVGCLLLCLASGAPISAVHRFRQENACVDLLDLGPTDFAVLRANDTSHLEEV